MQVCGSSGKRVKNGGNLCISKSDMRVYEVKSNVKRGECYVTAVDKGHHKVVLACNEVYNACLPVHYQKWTNQIEEKEDCNRS